MDYLPIIRDSILTSISMKIYKNKQESLMAHIYKSKLCKIPITKKIYNFDSNRLQKTALDAYPINNRPRGNKDLSSVKYYQKQIRQKKDIYPIFIVKKNNKYILLDGAHRIVASYIEGKKYISAYVIK